MATPDPILAHRIRSARIAFGLHPAWLAAKLGFTTAEIDDFEAGRRHVPAVVLCYLVGRTGLAMEWFFRSPAEKAVA